MPHGHALARSHASSRAGQPALERGDTAEPQREASPSAVPGLALAGPELGAIRRDAASGADPLGGAEIPGDVLSRLRQRRGGGQPLPPGTASDIGAHLGPAASAARLHTDSESDRLARSVQAVAFSYGSDVYFRQGAYAPDTESGQHLLAHELSHVAQGGRGGGGGTIGRADDPTEHEADRSAGRVLQALRRQASRVTGSGEPPIARSMPQPGSPAVAAVRRIYAEGERPAMLALPQVAGDHGRLNALSLHNWSLGDSMALAQAAPAPSYDELNAIMGAFSAAQARALAAICAGCTEIAALAAVGWPADDLVRTCQLAPPPTFAQLRTAAAFFTPAQLAGVMAICASWADVVTLAGLGWPAADLARVVGGAARPTLAQLQAVAAFFTPAQATTVQAICTSWADVVTLAGLGWAATDLVDLAGGDPAPTFAQLSAVATHFTATQLDDLAGTGGFAWDDLAGLALSAPPGNQSPAITLRNAINACNQLVAEDLAQLATLGLVVTPDRYKALLVGTNSLTDIDGMIVRDYLQDARWFSICFDTARRLLDDLGNGAAYASGGATDATYALAQQQTRSAQLVANLTAAAGAGAPVIFDIHVGGHGFTLTVIGNQVHQLEAFASQAARPGEDPGVLARGDDLQMSLLRSIGANHTYPIATVTTAITHMTSNSPANRNAGAGAMGWNAGPCGFLTGGAIADPMAIWWEARSLHNNAQIVVNIAQRIHRQRVEIREKLGLPAV